MFTGIVEYRAEVTHIEHKLEKSTLWISIPFTDDCGAVGDSISINGVCLTIVEIVNNSYVFQAMPETLRLTNIKSLKKNDYVNLERAMRATSRIGGHMVQGHSDGTAIIESIEHDGCALKIWFCKPEHYKDCFVPKGFIAIDGMSLTIVDVHDSCFSVCFIPHTQQMTIVQDYYIGTVVNIEIDHIAKTISSLLAQKGMSCQP